MRILKKIFNLLFLFSLITGIISWTHYTNLPNKDKILPSSSQEPVQKETTPKTIKEEKAGFRAQMDALYEYELYGLVVEDYDSSSAFDYVHSRYDPFNTKDICVLWGQNLQEEIYQKVEFTHGEFTCYFYAPSQDIYSRFNRHQISNNHLIPNNREIAAKIKQVKVGDQIHLKGYLVNNTITLPDGRFGTRRTSTTRTDSGNGACEVIYVENFDILSVGNWGWTVLYRLSKLLLIGSLLAIIVLFFIEVKIGWHHSKNIERAG